MNKNFGIKEPNNRNHENGIVSTGGASNRTLQLGASEPHANKKLKKDDMSSGGGGSGGKTGLIGDLYEFGDTIGRGHFATVKAARHKFTGERVAIKVIDKTKLDDISRDHLFQEVKCMKLVQHPNVVRLFDVIDSASKFYLVLEFGDGGDMYDYIMRHPNGLTEPKAKNYFGQIVDAIKYCHDLHVVHRDLKPENVVFFEQTGQVKLTDFGFSNVFEPGSKLYTSCGSLAYSAPEILLGDSYDAPAVDIWSLGVILFMLVTGRAPFQEANDSETLTMILDCKFYLPSHLSDECINLISNMLVRDPKGRIKLENIQKHDWLSSVCFRSKEAPLAVREHLSEKDSHDIIQTMVRGKIGEKNEIVQAIDKDEYNYITATYYLIAESILRKRYQEKHGKNGSQEVKAGQRGLADSISSIPQFYTSQDEPATVPTDENAEPAGQETKKKLKTPASGGSNNSTLPSTPSLEYATTNSMSVGLMTQIEEDEENPAEEFDYFEPDKNKPILKNVSNKLPAGSAAINSRRPSRGHDLNAITGMTILEEIETEVSTPNSLKNSILNPFKEIEEQIVVAEKAPNGGPIFDIGINYGDGLRRLSNGSSDDSKKELISNSETSDLKSKRLNLSRMSVGANGVCFDSAENEFILGAPGNELSVGREYNWTRTASATSSKSHQIRSDFARSSGKKGNSSLSANPNEIRKTRESLRPVSMSSDSYDEQSNNLMPKDRITVARTKSLVENSTLPNQGAVDPYNTAANSLLSTKKGSQALVFSNSHDHIPAAGFYDNKSLSIEHRLANMSQLSISSQLSKNNSFRVQNRAGVCDTPIQQHQHSATPTPRESTVFNRGDRNPFAKILQSAKLQQLHNEQKSEGANSSVDYLEEKFDFKDHPEPKSSQASYKAAKGKRSLLNTFNELENESEEEPASALSLKTDQKQKTPDRTDESDKQANTRSKKDSPEPPNETVVHRSSGLFDKSKSSRHYEKRSSQTESLKKALEENLSASSEDPQNSDTPYSDRQANKPLSSKKDLKNMGSSNSKHSYTKENASKFSNMGCSKCCVVI